MTARDLQAQLRGLANPADAAFLAGFFKTGPGQYGEGDRFLGIRVPVIRRVARQFQSLPPAEVERLLVSPLHEERLAALVILVLQFARADEPSRRRIYDFYLSHAGHINNWDLVDLSAPQIVGGHLESRSRKPLYTLARSARLWDRRIAIVATHHFIRRADFGDTLAIARLLLGDREDLIHKAVGWMLREVGKRDQSALVSFLDEHAATMPRTALRYAIERFPEKQRRAYLAIKRT